MDDLVVSGLVIPAEDLEERFDPSGGPGGQHANRSATAVTLRLDLIRASIPEDARGRLIARLGPVVEVRAAEHRSQSRNRALARDRLADRIAAALVPQQARRATRPTRASRERRKEEKRARSELKRSRRRPRADDPGG